MILLEVLANVNTLKVAKVGSIYYVILIKHKSIILGI